jgi:beta-phosphoglucomutase-like phosphatase (HAD superfamily)
MTSRCLRSRPGRSRSHCDGATALDAASNGKGAAARHRRTLADTDALHLQFKAVVIGDELPQGKPHPMPYLEGLRAVNAAADLSVAFEDSRSGIKSAAAAGIATVGIRTSLGHTQMIEAGALMTAGNFDDPELIEFLAIKMNW